ncbi:hypothetical protein GB937_001908 [Aspergillus fischeri]|nr:hypothetical protein GB937_001908 [Aspergillus fischeri]
MQDGLELVVKIPNPNAGASHYTTASEVATMQYVRSPSFELSKHREYDGPKPERFIQPSLPENIEELNTLWLYYKAQVYKEAPDLIHKQLVREDDYGNPGVPYPLNYSKYDLDKQSKEKYKKWERDMERKA